MAVLHSLISPWKRKGEKEKKQFLQHGLFGFGHTPKHYPRRTGLNFAERTKHVAFLVLWWLTVKRIVFKFLRWENVSKREKDIWYDTAGKVENKKNSGIWKWELLLAYVIRQAASVENIHIHQVIGTWDRVIFVRETQAIISKVPLACPITKTSNFPIFL